jgi:hypothetical protein
MTTPYRQLTDYMKEHLGDMDYGIVGRNIKDVFTHDFIKICINKFPKHKAKKMTPTQKSKYLLGMCKARATGVDYQKKDNRKLFNETDFSP